MAAPLGLVMMNTVVDAAEAAALAAHRRDCPRCQEPGHELAGPLPLPRPISPDALAVLNHLARGRTLRQACRTVGWSLGTLAWNRVRSVAFDQAVSRGVLLSDRLRHPTDAPALASHRRTCERCRDTAVLELLRPSVPGPLRRGFDPPANALLGHLQDGLTLEQATRAVGWSNSVLLRRRWRNELFDRAVIAAAARESRAVQPVPQGLSDHYPICRVEGCKCGNVAATPTT